MGIVIESGWYWKHVEDPNAEYELLSCDGMYKVDVDSAWMRNLVVYRALHDGKYYITSRERWDRRFTRSRPIVTGQLLPCPFCGGEPGTHKVGGSDERNGYNFLRYVSCGECGAQIHRQSHEGTGGWCDDTGQAETEAREAWNRRSRA